ncbi:ribonuclease HI family protein [Candidatus Daviesbacteria bacterium]|nr:ribonuclease HI family protein [Candidatus Daviesbacteria bacterium]
MGPAGSQPHPTSSLVTTTLRALDGAPRSPSPTYFIDYMKKFIVYTDGASRGNPGQAAAGFVIQTPDGVIWVQEGVYLGHATNNVAEYTAVKMAFEKLLKDFIKDLPTEIEVRADSMLVVRQLQGLFKMKNPTLRVLFEGIKDLEPKLGKIVYQHIPRSQNFLADRMANMALDRQALIEIDPDLIGVDQ